jgi:hypothetical protein
MGENILQQEGHALEGRVGRSLLCVLASALEGAINDRVQPRVEFLGARNRRIHHLERRHVPARDETGKTHSVIVDVFGKWHGSSPGERSDVRLRLSCFMGQRSGPTLGANTKLRGLETYVSSSGQRR